MDMFDSVVVAYGPFTFDLAMPIRAIRRAGFIVNDFVEARPSPHLLEKEPALAVDLRMCHFLVLKLLKKP